MVFTTATPPKELNEATPIPRDAPLPPPPQSAVNAYELGFGTVCGICAGVFVKKGARLAAFAFGGVFVLLQVSSSRTFQVQSTKISTVLRVIILRPRRLDPYGLAVRESVLQSRRSGCEAGPQRWISRTLDHRFLDSGLPAAGFIHSRICTGA